MFKKQKINGNRQPKKDAASSLKSTYPFVHVGVLADIFIQKAKAKIENKKEAVM